MLRRMCLWICMVVLAAGLAGCNSKKEVPKVGVSFGVGQAVRWTIEKSYMEEKAKELGMEIEVRLNTTDEPKTQLQDCKEMIDSGIDVLILTPRDVNNAGEILAYAREKKVPVINYARIILGEKVDLFVGYDSGRIGQSMGQYLSETVYEGDYIILKGSPGDYNATLLYDGAMRYITSIKDDINIILDEAVEGWSPDLAKEMVLKAVKENGNQVDAILAPNDKIAGACVEALEELGITDRVVITGMDAELDAVKRILAGQQDMTIYMDLKELAYTAVEEANLMASGQKMEVNAEFDNQSGSGIPSNLIVGQVVTSKNVDSILIDSGYLTREEIYGK